VEPSHAILGAWAELRDRAAERDMRIQWSATLTEAGTAVVASYPDEKAAVDALVSVSERAAYHPDKPTAEHSSAVWDAVDSLTSAFDRDATRWVRLKRAASLRSLRRSEAF
jgi:hypothetical protein